MFASPYQFEPLLPSRGLPDLYEQAERIAAASARLSNAAHPALRAELRELLRAMNSYYSNLIEGQSTHPSNIARALCRDFSRQPQTARLQRLALAHIEAECELEQRVAAGEEALASAFLLAAHAAIYARLPPPDRRLDDGSLIMPGALRTQLVEVGLHIAPTVQSLPRFLARMDERYGQLAGWPQRLLGIACLHHRAAWVHPFCDGNGRATRLQSHCALWPLSSGLWSCSRGLALDALQFLFPGLYPEAAQPLPD